MVRFFLVGTEEGPGWVVAAAADDELEEIGRSDGDVRQYPLEIRHVSACI